MATVLIVAERYLPEKDGLALATARIAQAAKARGEEVVVARLGAAADSTDIDGITVRTLAGELASFARELEKLVTELGVDLLHAVSAGHAGYGASVVARSLGLAHVVSVCADDLEERVFRLPDAAFIGEMLRGATVATAFTEELTRRASRLYGRPVEHVESPLAQASAGVAELEGALYGALYCRARSEPLTRRRL